MAEHGLHKTLYNVLLPYNQPKPGEQPLLQLGVHPWRNLIPEFLWSELFSSIIPAERAGLVNMLSRKWDHAFEGHWPSLLVLVSCSKQESSSTWTTRRWEGSLGLLNLVLNLCVASGTEMPEEEALAFQGLTSMKNSVPLYWNYKAHISRESSVTLQHLYQPEARCGGLQSFQWFSNQYILPEWESISVTSEAVWLTEQKENRAVVTDFSSRKWGQARNEMP